MISKVDILMPSDSQYGVLQHFTRKIYEAFTRTDLSCRLLQGDDCILVPLHSPPDFTLAVNGAIKMEDNSLLCDHLKIPHMAYLIDPAFRFLDLTHSPFIILACDDLFSSNLLKHTGFTKSCFLPHAVEKELIPDANLPRIYDVTVLATYINCETRRKAWKKNFPQALFRAMETTCERALTEDAVSFIVAGEEAFKSLNLDVNTLQRIFQEIELYIKGRDRLDLIEAIHDCDVHIFGNSIDQATWKTHYKNKKNIIVHASVSYLEALQVMKQSKIVLNSSIKNTHGAHERIFSAMACGAVVVTNDNIFLRSHYTKEEVIYYRHHDISSVNALVQKLLNNEPARIQMANKARQKVMKYDTWDHRVQQLLKDVTPMLKQIF